MNEQPARILKSMVERYGPSIACDPLRCEGLLRDTCPRCNKEIFVLVNAVRQHVPSDLLNPRHSLSPSLFRGFLVRRLQDELAFSDEAAQWAVDTWARALGLDNGSSAPGSSPNSFADMAPSAANRVPDPVSTGTSGTGTDQRASWVNGLESGSVEVRLGVVRQLAQSGDKENTRLLITSLENTVWRVREAAFDALLAMGEPAEPFLVEALGDPHNQVVIPAIIALATISSRGAVDPLVALLDAGGDPAVYAVWALGEIGDGRAITPLTRLLISSDARLRSGAEEALGKFP
ncbi:MAG: HEAT repeat domain-containing protein [Methanoregula sp.]|jgi:hypothetical protein|uniref:HEAT repeat domain-containing protein n=1 Tax=Methanoregula sp. TaxID=2052170 RepID=UPI0025D6C078|nr:HEAT repeat domain-containing protein [Methanoregula sp.]MCK9632048.1 HEAT repeat domain-containing protein [Methanoregula sp.]